MLENNRLQITNGPNDAAAVIASPSKVKYAPNLPLYVIASGTADDWVAKKIRPDAVFCENILEVTEAIAKPKLTVLPGARNPTVVKNIRWPKRNSSQPLGRAHAQKDR